MAPEPFGKPDDLTVGCGSRKGSYPAAQQQGTSMKRDMDLIREILLACEAYEHGYAPGKLQIDGYDNEQIEFHVYLMGQAGLLETADPTYSGSPSPSALPNAITWQGYEFLEASRNEQLWAKAKHAASCAGGMMFEVLKSVLTTLAAELAKRAMEAP